MTTLLPEVPERDAPPEIATIYDEMRRFTRLPLVNLIYRHFATMPGALPWVWGVLRPAFADGSLEAAASRVHAAVALPAVHRIDGSALPAHDWQSAAQVIAAYNRGNSLNLVGLTAIRLALDAPPPIRQSASAEVAPSAMAAIPPIVPVKDLDAGSAALVRRIADLHGVGGRGVIPSLYLHLANWPGFLAVVGERIAPLLEDGSVARAGEQAVAAARKEAGRLLPGLSAPAPLPGEHADPLRSVLDTFTGRAIPQMMCVGLALARAIDRN